MFDEDRPILSKSTFLKGLQCHKALYLYKHHYTLRDPVSKERQAAFNRGHKVGDLAHRLFPGGVNCKPSDPRRYRKAVEKTQEAINNGAKVIYEAAIQAERILVYIDLLVKTENGWAAYEVKSGTRISPIHVIDASLQYYVMEKAGMPPVDFSLVHVNTKYVKDGAIDPHQFFKIKSVKREMLTNWDFVERNVKELIETVLEPDIPEIRIGTQCLEPYPCDFRGVCWKEVPKEPIFELGGVSKKELFELYDHGIKRLADLPDNYNIPEKQRLQLTADKTGLPKVDRDQLKRFLDSLNYPLTLVDFETFMPAVPLFDGTRPFQHLPFLFSIHFISGPDSEPTAEAFLAEAGTDPRKSVLDAFLRMTEGEGDILAFDAKMEKLSLEKLKTHCPERAEEVDQRLKRLKDMQWIFEENHLVVPGMRGGPSLKNVVEALVPDFGYQEMAINNGLLANAKFEALQTETDMFKALEDREALIAYCQLDTLAMVRILEEVKNQIAVTAS